jgi:hypothetical protein
VSTPTSRADAEALALEVLVETMRNGNAPAKLQAALAVYPRTSAVPPSKGSKGDPTGFASVHIYTNADGETVASDDPPPGYVVPPRRGGPGDARDQ